MPRIDTAVDGCSEYDTAMFLQPDEGVAPFRGVGRKARAGDGDETPAGRQARQRRGDMAIGGVGHAPRDTRHRREGRVHDDDAGHKVGVQMVVDLRRIEAGDRDGRKEGGEKIRARVGKLVENESAAGDLGEDSEQPGARRGFQHGIARRDRGRGGGDKPERNRRRELLEGLTFFGAAGMGREEIGDLLEQR